MLFSKQNSGFDLPSKPLLGFVYAITAQQIICHDYGFFYLP